MRKTVLLLVVILGGFLFSGCQFINQIMDYKSKSGLQVITDDVPSSVFLNGQYLNSTPLIEKELKPGEYIVKIAPNDSSLVPYETSILLRKGLLTVVTWKPAARSEMSGGVIYEMEPLKDSTQSEVSFVTIPAGAIVSLENKEKDFSPVVYTDVEPGNRSFEVTLPSYETQNHTINVQAGYRMVVRIKLAKLLAINETKPAITPEPSLSATQSATNATLNKSSTASNSTLLSTSSARLRQ